MTDLSILLRKSSLDCEAAMAESFHAGWLAQGGAVSQIEQCIGYKKPLFFGGADTSINLELSDLDVYWTIARQFIQAVSNHDDSILTHFGVCHQIDLRPQEL